MSSLLINVKTFSVLFWIQGPLMSCITGALHPDPSTLMRGHLTCLGSSFLKLAKSSPQTLLHSIWLVQAQQEIARRRWHFKMDVQESIEKYSCSKREHKCNPRFKGKNNLLGWTWGCWDLTKKKKLLRLDLFQAWLKRANIFRSQDLTLQKQETWHSQTFCIFNCAKWVNPIIILICPCNLIYVKDTLWRDTVQM